MESEDPRLRATALINYDDPAVSAAAVGLAADNAEPVAYARAAFEFVRDDIPHTTTTGRQVVTVRASDVLAERTGICHAKANLLAALLRARGIPAGFGFQHLTLGDDDSAGYCLHAFVLADLAGRTLPLDPHPQVEFSRVNPQLAYPCRPEYDEYVLTGRWYDPDQGTITVLHNSPTLNDALTHLPDRPTTEPDDPTWPGSRTPGPTDPHPE
ncbi:MAG: hypothetical protein LBI33_05705 [Propionibacteriaceae bacterium]|jgi:transglutaminase-like putative cysteine protease|nr:hypothetical protein [Propionibacteriaceae bacterium]